MKNVTHFIRKSTQLKASFIQNQILCHINYIPSIVYKNLSVKDDGGFAEFNNKDIEILNLDNNSSIISKLKYKFIKLITQKDKERIKEFTKDSDILHFHYGTDAGIYLPLLKNINIPKVVSFYGYDCFGFPKMFFGYGKIYLKKRVFELADKIFAMTPEMEQDLLLLGCPVEKIKVHYHGSDIQSFKTNRVYLKKNEINFLIISGLQPEKGHLLLIEAFHKAFNNDPSKILKLVGEGPCKEKILNKIAKKGINNITLNNNVIYKSKEHLNYLHQADIFIHPSIITKEDKEGIPGAIVEAMASGLPVISTLIGGIPFIIQNMKTGILVKERDINALSNAIIKLANNTELRMKLGINGQNYVTDNLDLKDKEKELENIYNNLID